MSFANGNSTSSTTTTAMIERMSRVRSSIRCERNDSCGSAGSLIGSARVALRAATSNLVEARQSGLFGWRLGDGSRCRLRGDRGCGPIGRRRLDRLLRRLVELALDVAHAARDVARRRLHALLEILRRAVHLALQPAQFVELDFAADVGLDVVDVALQAAEQEADSARGLRQPLG